MNKHLQILGLVKIRRVAGSIIISLPPEVLIAAGLTEGDHVLLGVDDKKKIIVQPNWIIGE